MFELAKAAPVEVLPDSETRYDAGSFRVIDEGTVKLTRRVVPVMVVTAVALVVTAVPPDAGSSFTSVSAGKMVPAGNPEPVMLTLVTPLCAVAGDAAGESVTAVCPYNVVCPAIKTNNPNPVARRTISP